METKVIETTPTETTNRILPEGLHAATITAVAFDETTHNLYFTFANETGKALWRFLRDEVSSNEAFADYIPHAVRRLTDKISAPLTMTFEPTTLNLTANLKELVGRDYLIVVEHIPAPFRGDRGLDKQAEVAIVAAVVGELPKVGTRGFINDATLKTDVDVVVEHVIPSGKLAGMLVIRHIQYEGGAECTFPAKLSVVDRKKFQTD